MTGIRVFAARCAGLFRRSSAERRLADEIRAHLDLLTDDYVAQGMSPEDARFAARKAFGGVDQVKAIYRDQRGLPSLEICFQDLRHAIVALRRNPGYAASAIVTLALGIGATTAVFSLVYGVLLRPLPYPEADRLVRLWEEHPGGTTATGSRWLSNRTYHAWSPGSTTIETIGAYATTTAMVAGDDASVPLAGISATPSVFGMVGATPALGRLFTFDDAADPDARVVLISSGMWAERYGGDPDVVGTTLVIDDEPLTVIGVVAPGVTFPDARARRVQFWRPYRVPRVEAQPQRTVAFNSLARLRPGATPAQAEAEGTAAARSVERPLSTELFFGQGGPVVVHARTLAADMAAPVRPALVALSVAVALILLIASANVAGLLLSRGAARQRELAVRLAVGASRGRLAWQSLAESLVLSLAAGLLGVGLAWSLVRLLPAIAPAQFPRLHDVRLDTTVLGFALLAATAAAVLSGLLPALRSAAADAMPAFRSGDGGTEAGFQTRGARLLRDGLLVAESAFAVVLLVGATLLGHSLVRLVHVDAGYEPEGVLTTAVRMPRDAPPERSAAFIETVLQHLSHVPGVLSAGAATTTPMNGLTAITSFPVPASDGSGTVMTRSVTYIATPGYAEAIGLRLKAGRFFTPADRRPGIRSMIVNEEFARHVRR